MKRLLGLASFLLIFESAFSQNHLLIKKELVENYSGLPVAGMIYDDAAKGILKKRFSYIDNIEVYKITYLSDDLKVNGLLVKPKSIGNYPVIIFNRGGNREYGKLTIGAGLTILGLIASRGYVVLASQYRGNSGSEGNEEFGGADVDDVINLIDVAGEIEEADTGKIGMFGISRGGMETYLALTRTHKVKAAATIGGLSDLFSFINDRPALEESVLAQLIPDYPMHKEEELTKRSAVRWAEKFPKNVPLLLVQGTADWRVNPNQSLALAKQFNKYKIPYRLIMFEGSDHGISEHREEVMQQVNNWFHRFLILNEDLPDMEPHGN